MNDNVSTHEQSGVIRAFDADSGALVWNWDSGNPDNTAPLAAGQTYTVNSPNSWLIGSVDEALGMVYLPLGNQTPDQWGGRRSAAVERYSSSVVALDLKTGQVRWVFQTVHHDLWDDDVPAQPSLVDLQIGDAIVPALVQPTKQGERFVLDRRTGTPLQPVSEVPAPQRAAAGDRTAATQPVSSRSFDPPRLQGRDMWGGTALVVNRQAPEGALPALNENFGAPFATEMKPFTSPLSLPCQAPRPGAWWRGAELLWRSRLPAGGQATPMSYLGADGRQYVLVVAGGHGSLGTKKGDSVLAYALPGNSGAR